MATPATSEEALSALRAWKLEQGIFITSVKLGVAGAESDYASFVNAVQDRAIADLAAPPTLGDALLELMITGMVGHVASGLITSGLQKLLRSRLDYVSYRVDVKVPKNKRHDVLRKLRMGGETASPHKKRKRIKLEVNRIVDDGSLEHFLYTLTPAVGELLGSGVEELLNEDLKRPAKPPAWRPNAPAGFVERLNTWIEAKDLYNSQLYSYLVDEVRGGNVSEILDHVAPQVLSSSTDLVSESYIQEELTRGQVGNKQLVLSALFALHTRGQFGKVANGWRQARRELEEFPIPETKAWSKNAEAVADEIAVRLHHPHDPHGRTFARWARDDMERFYDPARTQVSDEVWQRQKDIIPGKAVQQHRGAVAVYLQQVFRDLQKHPHMAAYIRSLR